MHMPENGHHDLARTIWDVWKDAVKNKALPPNFPRIDKRFIHASGHQLLELFQPSSKSQPTSSRKSKRRVPRDGDDPKDRKIDKLKREIQELELERARHEQWRESVESELKECEARRIAYKCIADASLEHIREFEPIPVWIRSLPLFDEMYAGYLPENESDGDEDQDEDQHGDHHNGGSHNNDDDDGHNGDGDGAHNGNGDGAGGGQLVMVGNEPEEAAQDGDGQQVLVGDEAEEAAQDGDGQQVLVVGDLEEAAQDGGGQQISVDNELENAVQDDDDVLAELMTPGLFVESITQCMRRAPNEDNVGYNAHENESELVSQSIDNLRKDLLSQYPPDDDIHKQSLYIDNDSGDEHVQSDAQSIDDGVDEKAAAKSVGVGGANAAHKPRHGRWDSEGILDLTQDGDGVVVDQKEDESASNPPAGPTQCGTSSVYPRFWNSMDPAEERRNAHFPKPPKKRHKSCSQF